MSRTMRTAPSGPGRRRTLILGAVAALVAWGCDGNNLFGPGVSLGPQIVEFETPASVRSGESMDVHLRAVGLVRVDSVVITATGGEFALRSVRLSQNGESDFSTVASFEIPRPITDTLVVVTGVAFDAQANRSLPSVDTVRAIDTTPPTVSVALSDPVVGQGYPLSVRVDAEDNIGLRWVGYRIRSPDGQVIAADSAMISGREAETGFEYPVPLELPLDEAYSAIGFAHDLEGNVGVSEASAFEVIFIDTELPVVQILAPSANTQVAEGDSVFVRVRVTDNDAVSRVRIEGVALRGDPDMGTDQVVPRFEPWDIELSPASPDTTLTRYLQANQLLGTEPLHIIVTATDRQENSAADTVVVQLLADEDPPRVVVVGPGEGAVLPVGSPVAVRARVSDPDGFVRSGVVHVRFQGIALRGDPALLAQEEIVRFQPQEVTLSPPQVTEQVIERVLLPLPDDTEEQVLFIVTATDARGNVGADTVVVDLESDAETPTIVILEPTSGSGAPLNDSIFVSARIQHPVGIVRVTYDGVAHRGDPELGTDQVIQRFEPRSVEFVPAQTDTILNRYLQPTADQTSEIVWIRVVAEDEGGNVARDSVAVEMGGPRVTLPDLQTGQTVAGGQEIEIRILAEDPAGVNLVEVEITGVANQTLTDLELTGQDPTAVDLSFPFTTPSGVNGPLNVRARARNVNGIFGQAPLVVLNVVDQAAIDTTPPEVRIVVEPLGATGDRGRIELTDTIRVSVTARDNTGGTGVRVAGYTARVVRRANQADTLWLTDEFATPGGVGSTITRVFRPTVLEDFVDSFGEPFYDPVNRPDTLDVDFFGWAQDAAFDADLNPAPNCAAAVSAVNFQQLPCSTVTVGGDAFRVATGETGQRVVLAVVSGQTVRLPAGGVVADAVVDPIEARGFLFLSNIALSRLEVFNLQTRTFGSPVLVGAQPWGLAFGLQDPNRLYVSNSGGTNISVVNVTTLQEILAERILTPNTLLFDVREAQTTGGTTFEVTPYDFSDRPQFIAQDADGRLVYSTRPTGAAPDGTIRVAEGFGGETEVYLFADHGTTQVQDGTYALGNVDDLVLRSFSGGAGIVASRNRPYAAGTIFSDTIPGVLGATPLAVNDLRGKVQAHLDAISYGVGGPGGGASDFPSIFLPTARGGSWNIPSVGLSDTTFIAASGDGSVIAIGEGATAQTGRIFLWRASPSAPSISSFTSVIDLVGNASERVLGVDMNEDGTLGVGRGIFEAYFFDADLRLQGTTVLEPGGAGVALHPLHANGPVGTNQNTALAFIPAGNRQIHIVNTLNFNRVGRVHVRDVITGPLRASLPYASDNAGLSCPTLAGGALNLTTAEDACVAVKLSGISSDGGVVVVDVTKGDIFRSP
jgi:hypothetical protein